MITDKEIEEALREWVQDTGEHHRKYSLDSWGGQWEGFVTGAKWMQEKMKEENEKNEKSDYEHDLQFNSCI